MTQIRSDADDSIQDILPKQTLSAAAEPAQVAEIIAEEAQQARLCTAARLLIQTAQHWNAVSAAVGQDDQAGAEPAETALPATKMTKGARKTIVNELTFLAG